jgi:hypothetical protein
MYNLIFSNNPKFNINNIILLMMIGIYWLKSIILAQDIFEVPERDVLCKFELYFLLIYI